jgi:putative membrane-bound dehydrogenase-like protein
MKQLIKMIRPFMYLLLLVFLGIPFAFSAEPVALFNGHSFEGWEGNTQEVWRIEDGAIVGGSLDGNPQNEFLATTSLYNHFRLTLEYKLIGSEGFVNGGVQFHSRRITDPANEMIGYQADIGAGWSGSLYDESRRKTMLAIADKERLGRIEKPGEWNRYEVVSIGNQVKIFLNNSHMITYVETDPDIEQEGLIALQIHSGCKAEISFRNIMIEALPVPISPPDGVVLNRFGNGQPADTRLPFDSGVFAPVENEVVVMIGQENFVREQKAAAFESRMLAGFASLNLRFRSMAWEGDTVYEQWRELNFGDWADQLETAQAGMLIIQFGQMEAFDGVERLTEFKAAYHRLLDQFSQQTRRVVLVSPMPFEKPLASHAPDLTLRNEDVAAYADAIRDIAKERSLVFLDLFEALNQRVGDAPRLTEDGIHLTQYGLKGVGELMASELGAPSTLSVEMDALSELVLAKNKLWFDSWRPANWSFVYGDRVSQMFGRAAGKQPSLRESFEQRRPMIETLDEYIHQLVNGSEAPLPTLFLTEEIVSSPLAMTPEEQQATFEMDEGFQVNLYASEREDVVNPVQIAWDEKGRLFVACSPSYPQSLSSRPPSDYVLVLEDTDQDGKADRHWRFAEGLNMIQGLELGPDGLYVCDFDQLIYLKDEDGDLRADSNQTLFSGFGIGDTHQLVNSISTGPDGSLWFTQGLHAMSVVETPWGITRLDRAAVWRLRPRTLRLEGFFGGGMAGANCWGVTFDDFGQVFHKTGDRPHGYWTVPGMVRGASSIGSGSRESANQSYANSPEQYHSVGALFETSPKTTSIDIVGTQAMPDDIQGTALIGGYFGSVVELHRFHDDGAGYKTSQLPKVMRASNNAFRPVDVSMGPDGSMYLADWYNPVIGHYQASYADPKRDKHHGRIWRISSTRHAPVRQPDLANMSSLELLDQLKSPERWARYQAKRLLFYQPTTEVMKAADAWVENNLETSPESGRWLLELLGVYQAHESPRPDLVERMLKAQDFRVRAYAARAIGGWADRWPDAAEWLRKTVNDEHPRVRLEAVVASSYLQSTEAVSIATKVLDYPMDRFLDYALRQSVRALQPLWESQWGDGSLRFDTVKQENYVRDLIGNPTMPPSEGEKLYEQACLPCHQPEGKGLAGVYPPLEKNDWIEGDPNRLIRIVLQGLAGPITVNGQAFQSQTPTVMPSFAGLADEQIADLLSYLRQSFGNQAMEVAADAVRQMRARTLGRENPWTALELE